MRSHASRHIGKQHTLSITEPQIRKKPKPEELGKQRALGILQQDNPQRLVLKVRIKGE
jgi:hypothetical protein